MKSQLGSGEREGEEMNESWKINEEKLCGRLLQVIHGRKTDNADTKIITTFRRQGFLVFSNFRISASHLSVVINQTKTK